MRRTGKGAGRAARASAVLFPLVLLLGGCKLGTFPDPNNPTGAGRLQPEVMRRQLQGASDALYARRAAGEISEERYRDLLANFADDLVANTKIESVDPASAWEYGQVFRTARLWKQAEAFFRVAVKAAVAAKNEDRRVNDSLWLAQALAQQGQVAEAITTARSTFDTPPAYKVPILYGVLLEIAPAAQGKGHDADLARLLEDAIRQSEMNKVDNKTEEGRAFLLALPHHQRNARRLAASLYLSAGKPEDAERVLGGKLRTMRI